ncbi:MAG: M56 family metallopeptidase [Chloroflexota bacterium]
MDFLSSFPGQYIVQSVSYSLVTVLTVHLLLKIWRITEPRLRFQFYLLALLLPVVLPPLFYLAYPQRSGLYFREHTALIDLNQWFNLRVWHQVTLWHLASVLLALTTGLFLVQESIPWIRRRSLHRSLKALSPDTLPALNMTIGDVSRLMGRSVPQVMSSPEAGPAIYTVGTARPVIAISPDLLDTAEPEELKAMLCHEVAHLVRRDHWTGWALVLLRSLAFYNPVAWFISRLLWQENEKACDDIAASRIGDSRPLASSLTKAATPAEGPELDSGPSPRWHRWAWERADSLERRASRAQIEERAGRLLRPERNNDGAWGTARLWTTTALLATLLFFVV